MQKTDFGKIMQIIYPKKRKTKKNEIKTKYKNILKLKLSIHIIISNA